MKRFTNGWTIVKVVLSPQEIEQFLSGFHHINFQSQVEIAEKARDKTTKEYKKNKSF